MKCAKLSAILISIGTVAIMAAACGRMAPLDSPYDAAVEARRQAIEDGDAVVPPQPKPLVRDKKFFLDPLI